jgi:hypothetical protein
MTTSVDVIQKHNTIKFPKFVMLCFERDRRSTQISIFIRAFVGAVIISMAASTTLAHDVVRVGYIVALKSPKPNCIFIHIIASTRCTRIMNVSNFIVVDYISHMCMSAVAPPHASYNIVCCRYMAGAETGHVSAARGAWSKCPRTLENRRTLDRSCGLP